MEVNKIYFSQEGKIQVHQSRIKPCPLNFPSGYYWYGTCRKSTGCPSKSCGPNKNSTKKSVEPSDKLVQEGAGSPPTSSNSTKVSSKPPTKKRTPAQDNFNLRDCTASSD